MMQGESAIYDESHKVSIFCERTVRVPSLFCFYINTFRIFMTAVMIVFEGTDGTHCSTGHGSWYCSG